MSSDWCELGTATIADGVISARCKGAAIDEDGTAPDYGDAVPMMCALGVTAMPYPPTKEGAAEGLIDRSVPGLNGAVTAARDTRSAKIVGGMKQGDTVLHTTGPQQAAQVQLKEEKRIAAVLSKTGSGKTMMIIVNGDSEQIQITAAGAMFQIDKNGDVSIVGAGGAGILIQGGNIHFLGNPVLGAGNPPGFGFALVPLTGSPGGVASTPLLVAQSVTPG